MAFQVPPFPKSVELIESQQHLTQGYSLAVPNEPFISEDKEDVRNFLLQELECKVLDELAPHFYIFAKRRASHVDTLHEYDNTKRSVTVSENPGLHLVRNYDVVYCKPIPHCLLNYDFWVRYLRPNEHFDAKSDGEVASSLEGLSVECRSALGLLRTYTYLIKHESDFNIARRIGLVPSTITYSRFQYFIAYFRDIPDAAVSRRYEYGHIRLTRLNLAVRILRPIALGKKFPWTYTHMNMHAGQFVGRFAAPLLFFFACLTLILSSMQVGLAAQPSGNGPDGQEGRWDDFTAVSRWFSVTIMGGIIGFAFLVCGGIVLYIINRILLGYLVHRRWLDGKSRSRSEASRVSQA